eukprot:56705-Eustigmatos_ZCMA.PRE.1
MRVLGHLTCVAHSHHRKVLGHAHVERPRQLDVRRIAMSKPPVPEHGIHRHIGLLLTLALLHAGLLLTRTLLHLLTVDVQQIQVVGFTQRECRALEGDRASCILEVDGAACRRDPLD